jgi:UDP-N-acetylglucosamine transferase subunit ALG13
MIGASDDSLWVTFRTAQSESLLAGKRVLYVPYVKSRDLLGAAHAAWLVNKALSEERFDLAVSTGSAIAATILPLARLRGVKTVYIESVSRVDGPSLSGRIINATGSAAVRTQHRSWADAKWLPVPSVLSTYKVKPRPEVERPRLFVTLGTIEGYPFHSLIESVLATGLADERTIWQLGSTHARMDLPGSVYEQVSADLFSTYAREADVVVSHAGVGTVLGLLELGVRPVLAVRRSARGEHVDDHQSQIAKLATELNIAEVSETPDLDSGVIRAASGWEIDLAVRGARLESIR